MITCSAWRGKRFAVLGLARSGAATVRALVASGAEVVAWDEREEGRNAFLRHAELVSASTPQPGTASPAETWTLKQGQGDGSLVVGDSLQTDLTGFDGVVVSPGVPLNTHPIAAHAAKYGVPVIGDIELFAQARRELPPHKVVGITGTNGKSTTTALVHHILKTAGVPTTMGGNIGLPILEQEPLTPNDKGVGVYVLELSSYQIDLTLSLDCDVAVLLNVTPDHLDRYASFEAYAASKARIFEMQSGGHLQIVNIDDPAAEEIECTLHPVTGSGASQCQVWAKWLGNQIEWPALQGPHNGQNVAIAVNAALGLGLSQKDIASALRTFPGLPHRMERIRDRDGVLFVNDSKATNPESAAPALAAYPAVRWICGGQAKTKSLDACAPHFAHVKSAYTIGEAADLFADLLKSHMPVDVSGTLEEAIKAAARDAQPGETVLLSPACASFDQFKDFEDRGHQFRAIVEAL